MTQENPFKPKLWVDRTPEQSIELYTDWAKNYESDVSERGYRTPFRIAEALLKFKSEFDGPILDYGCGTGYSGLSLVQAGFTELHGSDITPEMLKQAEEKQIYQKLWQGEPGEVPAYPGHYKCIVAAGVISLGAAPPETLSLCLDALTKDGLIAFSFNEPTIEDGSYDKVLDDEIEKGRGEVIYRESGPHFDDIDMKSDVIIIRKK